MAETLDISVKTVETQIRIAMKKLMEGFKEITNSETHRISPYLNYKSPASFLKRGFLM